MTKISLISLGCAKNLVDSEHMLARLREAGYAITDEMSEADVGIVNTCGVIEAAKSEAIEPLLDVARYKEEGTLKGLIVTAALLIFIEKGIFPSWMVFIILAREFIITSLRIVAANKGRVLAATWTGKVKTCVQIAGIILDFLLLIFAASADFTAVFGTAGSLGVIGGADGPTCILVGGISLPSIVAWVMTLVTLYSGWDYLRKNWDLIKDGAVKEK